MKPFLQGKETLPLSSLRPPPTPACSPFPSCDSARTGTPSAGEPVSGSVEVIKEGDKVVRLVVTCRCGERIDIECLYPAGS